MTKAMAITVVKEREPDIEVVMINPVEEAIDAAIEELHEWWHNRPADKTEIEVLVAGQTGNWQLPLLVSKIFEAALLYEPIDIEIKREACGGDLIVKWAMP